MLFVAVDSETADRLKLAPQAGVNTAQRGTAYTVSVDATAAFGITTGVSTTERAATIRRLADPAAVPGDFDRPGHVQPIRARDGGTLVRAGHTEGMTDLCRLAGLRPVRVRDRGHARRRRDGPPAGPRSLRRQAQAQGLHGRRRDPLPHAAGDARQARRAGPSADAVGRVRAVRLRLGDRPEPAPGAGQGRRHRPAAPRRLGRAGRRGDAGAGPQRVPDRRRLRLRPVRLRGPARFGHAADRNGGPGRAALPAAGGARRGADEQAARLPIARRGAGHDRGEPEARLARRPAGVRHRRADPEGSGPAAAAGADEQSEEDLRHRGPRVGGGRNSSRSSSRRASTTRRTSRPSASGWATPCDRRAAWSSRGQGFQPV